MRPARRFDDRARLSGRIVERVEAGIGVGLQQALVGQMPLGMLAAVGE
jgi:hypothetical protein